MIVCRFNDGHMSEAEINEQMEAWQQIGEMYISHEYRKQQRIDGGKNDV